MWCKLAYLLLLVAAIAGLEVEVRARDDKKLKYAQYLAKVRGFFNVTARL